MAYACSHARSATGEVLRPGGLALTDTALAMCALPCAARVLDVGCGTGAVVAYLKERYGFRAFGIDCSAAAGHCMRAVAESLPVKDAACDCVMSECVLSLVPHAKRCLHEMYRVLRHGGYAILSDIYDRSQPDHEVELLRCSGFEVVLWQDHTRSLREVAAAAALQGRSGDICLPAGFCPQQAGYYLAIARKEKG